MSVLMLKVSKKKLKKGAKCHVTFNRVIKPKSINHLVFWEDGCVYAVAVLFGISVDNIEIAKIFSNEELGINDYRRDKFNNSPDDKKATFINWDYPICFTEPIRVPWNNVGSFSRPSLESYKEKIVKEIDAVIY